MAPKAFWWQWPCTSSGCVGRRAAAGAKRPAARFAREEFLEQQRLRRQPLGARRPGPCTSISSRSVSRHEGSSPTMAMPASTKGAKASSSAPRARLAPASTRPAASKVRPQHSARAVGAGVATCTA